MKLFAGLRKKKKAAKAPPPPPQKQPPPPPPPAIRVTQQQQQPPVTQHQQQREETPVWNNNNNMGGEAPSNSMSTVVEPGRVTTVERIPSPSPSTTAPHSLSDYEANRAAIDLTRSLVKRFIADIWNRGEVDCIPEVCSPSLRFNGNTGFDRVGHDGLARMVQTIREALDDYHCEIHSMVVEHNKAFCRLRFTGKHTGNLLGYPPTRKVVAWMGATEFTCQNGKILKVWELGDIKTLEEQLTNLPDDSEEV